MYYNKWTKKWVKTLKIVESCGGFVREMLIEPPASLEEVEEIEKKIGVPLPPSFRETLLIFSRKVDIYYSFPDSAVLPSKFKDIFSGHIEWNIDDIENLNIWANEEELEDGEESEYAQSLRNKIVFCHVGNGDMITFQIDQEKDSEYPVVYWNHEGEGEPLLAKSFREYIEKVNDLYLVGNEMWQYEPFLTKNGIQSKGKTAKEWRKWFDYFTSLRLEDNKHDLDLLLKYLQSYGEIGEAEIEALSKFEKDVLLSKTVEKIHSIPEEDAEVFYAIIAKVVKENAKDWVYSLWKTENGIPVVKRSYLTGYCLPDQAALYLVAEYLKSECGSKIDSWEARKHLEYFHSREVIKWMKQRLNFPEAYHWAYLFIVNQPVWEDVVEWVNATDRHRTVIVQCLEQHPEDFLSKKIIPDLPDKEEVLTLLNHLKEKEILRYRQKVIDCSIEKFLEKRV